MGYESVENPVLIPVRHLQARLLRTAFEELRHTLKLQYTIGALIARSSGDTTGQEDCFRRIYDVGWVLRGRRNTTKLLVLPFRHGL